MRFSSTSFVLIACAVFVSAGAGLAGQAQRPRAEVTAVADQAAARPGQTVTVSLKVRLPKDVHVQANKPRDPLLIPTVLTAEPPAGVSVQDVIYPQPSELAQAGRSDALLVLGPEFEIKARLTLAASVAAGPLTVPAVLRYQACNETLCFPPSRATAQWSLTVEP